jgi:NAD(P)-dependent dehydrogenase (short-subunit alcohol dehydrogenase family)
MSSTGLFAVTGAGSGIGRGVARRIAEDGARVAVLDGNRDAAQAVAEELDAKAHVLDVSDPHAVGEVFGRLGPLQGLVSCAGISDVTPIIGMSPDTWRRVLAVQLDGTFFCLQAAARNMIAHGVAGTIVNTASVNATFGHRGLSAYSAAKAGIVMLTKVAALEFAQAGIRVNAVAPGIVETGMTAQVIRDPEFVRSWSAATPLGRLGRPDDIADVVFFLSSPASRWMTGQILAVDGGGSLRVEPKMFPDDAWSDEALKALS